jgi:hypothetical protein
VTYRIAKHVWLTEEMDFVWSGTRNRYECRRGSNRYYVPENMFKANVSYATFQRAVYNVIHRKEGPPPPPETFSA